MSAYTPDDVLPAPQRRIRHITTLQIRNLTPFPARDALAQSLIQPTPNPSSLHQQPADDIDLTWAARRRRRVSGGSVSSVFNAEVEDEGGLGTAGTRRQKRTNSKGSSPNPWNMFPGTGTSTIRPRARPSLKAVHTSPSAGKENSQSLREWDTLPAAGQFITHSQRALEKIVSSRLVESFVTLTLPRSPIGTPSNSRPSSPMLASATTASPSRKGKDVSVKRATSASAITHRRETSTSSLASTLTTPSSSRTKRTRSLASPTPNSPSSNRSGASDRTSASSKTNFLSPPPTPPPRSPPRYSPTPSTSGPRPSTVSNRKSGKGKEDTPPSSISTPFYISPPHLPSINPCFSHLDPEREFAPWADLSGSHVEVAIWGRHDQGLSGNYGNVDMKGKGKASTQKDEPVWKILEEWDVNLNDMERLSADVSGHQMPSNTLIITVASGETFRIPPISFKAPSRAPSPLGPEYNSDGEVSDLRHLSWERDESDDRRRELETFEKSRRETRMKRSACWQDLVKMVNLQTCIIDTRESLEDVVRTCNSLMEEDEHSTTLRGISERGEWLRSLHSQREQVVQGTVKVKETVEARRTALKLRRENLAAARSLHEQDLRGYATQAQEVEQERQRHATLVASLSPLRTTLIQTVSFIFPIEPLSAPDLLFTILGAPLPIPVSASDPAPPLTLSSQPEVTEENTATALGYISQVVQLISAYLGKGLVYPVTCCGSRSVIKDPISAMMGPRIFPLYPKGVETYRFEYGVFLLNKDIEMLMMDRDLRAMDMRHTLPNLKNLLLTLTVGEGVKQTRRTRSPDSVVITSQLPSPTRAISPLRLETSHSELHGDESLPKAAGISSRKSTPFLSPLAAILRARYPSSAGRPTVKVVDETPEPPANAEPDTNPELRDDNPDDTSLPNGEEAKATLKSNESALPRPAVNAQGTLFEKVGKGNEHIPPSPLTNAM